MGQLDIGSAQYGDMNSRVADVTIDTQQTDGVTEQKETRWQNSKWTTWFGIYKEIPEVKIAFDMRAVWTIGNGFQADNRTTVILDNITGWGVDTFDSILKNMFIIKRVAGDSFAHIIRGDDGTLLNLKPLDPGSIVTIVNKKGIITGYEQTSKVEGKRPKKFKPQEIFHLTNKRVADEIHGTSDIEALEAIITANKESFSDIRKLMHRYVKPMMKFILDTDDTTKINAFVKKYDETVNKGDNLYLPKGTVEHELIAVPSNATLNPIPWRDHLRNYFFQVVGIPQIILGSSGEFTESTAKIAYLAFEQSVKDEQNYIEAQLWSQLAIRIKLEFPASLKNEMLSDASKDETQGAVQPNDVTAGVGE